MNALNLIRNAYPLVILVSVVGLAFDFLAWRF